MRRITWFPILLVMLLLAACASSSEPMAIEFIHAQDLGVLEYTATGDAVDEDVVFPNGTQEIFRLENMEGTEITDEEWAVMFDSALADGTAAEMMVYTEWTAGDGSGTFTLVHHTVFDFATFEFEGQADVGTWEITEGTGANEELTGSGNVMLDWEAGRVIYSGEVTES